MTLLPSRWAVVCLAVLVSSGCGDEKSPGEPERSEWERRLNVPSEDFLLEASEALEMAQEVNPRRGTQRSTMTEEQAKAAGLTPEEAAYHGHWDYVFWPGRPHLFVRTDRTFAYFAPSEKDEPTTTGTWRVEDGVLVLSHDEHNGVAVSGEPRITRHVSLWKPPEIMEAPGCD